MEEITISQEILEERYGLAIERIRCIPREVLKREELKQYFDRVAAFLLLLDDTKKFLAEGGLEKAALEELQKRPFYRIQYHLPLINETLIFQLLQLLLYRVFLHLLLKIPNFLHSILVFHLLDIQQLLIVYQMDLF